jgi:NADPH:quinone reductase-like Zn-dependent oxidoreductase
MKACWITHEGGESRFDVRDTPVPETKAGEVRIRVRASALNRGEIMASVGIHAGDPPRIGGNEASGEVDALGPGVAGVRIGDRVFGRARGGFADFAILPVAELVPMPARLTFEKAAAIPIAFYTAHDMIRTWGRLQSGEWLLVTGASSGVGVACIQIARLMGARTIATSGSADKLGRLRALGLDVGLQTRASDFAGWVREATDGHGADLVINNVGGTVFAECIRSMAYRGRLATVGYVDGSVTAQIDLSAVHQHCLEIFGVSNKLRTPEMKAHTVAGFRQDLLPAFADGRLEPVIDKTFAFEDIAAAKAHMDANRHVGKIVVRL